MVIYLCSSAVTYTRLYLNLLWKINNYIANFTKVIFISLSIYSLKLVKIIDFLFMKRFSFKSKLYLITEIKPNDLLVSVS